MAVTYGFFNSVNGDRKYNAEQMSEYFRGIVNEGVFQHLDGGLTVTAGTGLAVSVASGRAIIQNRWVQNSDAMTLSISAASETYARKDAVVVRLNYSTRSIEIAVKAGTPAASPVAPSMTRNSTTYEMALAYVNVAANATSVTVTDKRSDNTVCGWVTVAQSTSGEVDAMLNAMKTGFDGVTYDSPVEMVQGCDEKLDDKIDEIATIADHSDLYTDKTALSNTILNSVGWTQSDNSYDTSAYSIEVEEGETYIFSYNGSPMTVAKIIIKSVNSIAAGAGGVVQAANNQSGALTISTGAKYMFFSTTKNYDISKIAVQKGSTIYPVGIDVTLKDNVKTPRIETEISDVVDDFNSEIGIETYTNIEYGKSKDQELTINISNTLTHLDRSTNGFSASNNHTYFVYFEFEVGENNTCKTGSLVPYFRNYTAYTNLAIPTNQAQNANLTESTQAGDRIILYGYRTMTSDYTSIGTWIEYAGSPVGYVLDIIPIKNYVIDITNLNKDKVFETIVSASGQQQTIQSESYIPGILSDIEDLKESLPYSDVDLICWGDSLTAGAGGAKSYPQVCAEELGITYRNCGVGGENANTIAARQGGNNVIIPSGSVNGTYLSLSDLFGANIAPLLQGTGADSGNKIFINGEWCDLSYSSSTYTISGYTGESLSIPAIGKFRGSDYRGKITVIWVGQNGSTYTGLTGIDARIAIINSMIKHLDNNNYVIFGLSTGSDSTMNDQDNALLAEYGNKFFPVRRLLVENGLTLEGITPTAQDEAEMTAGTVPTSLRSDVTHLNTAGYDAVGKMLADKIRSLGYVS